MDDHALLLHSDGIEQTILNADTLMYTHFLSEFKRKLDLSRVGGSKHGIGLWPVSVDQRAADQSD